MSTFVLCSLTGIYSFTPFISIHLSECVNQKQEQCVCTVLCMRQLSDVVWGLMVLMVFNPAELKQSQNLLEGLRWRTVPQVLSG